jgi:putative membrane protein
MIEWWSAEIGGDGADAFLGAQGDIWDSHWDMLLALVGSILAQLSFAPVHDRALDVLPMQLRNRVGPK